MAEHVVTQYALDVLDGTHVAGRLVRLACARHLRDLEAGHKRGLLFNPGAADRVISFFPRVLRHYKGEWAGQPIRLSDWQAFVVGSLFGWVREDTGLRRFRLLYEEVARKNGKSTKLAGIGLYGLVGDGEPGAEIYAAATKKEQARIVFEAGSAMALSSPGLRKRLVVQKHVIRGPDAGTFQPLSADTKKMDGFNVHVGLIDEFHAHPNAEVFDVLDTGMGARRQPLIAIITTAGNNMRSICRQYHEYVRRVLEGHYDDEQADATFGYIATLDEGDDWRDPAHWPKANPGLGVSVKPENLQEQLDKAKSMPAAVAAFQQKRLDIWVQSVHRWLPADLWARGGDPIDVAALKGRECFGGLDLAKVHDLSAFVLLFPPQDEGDRWVLLAKFYVPEDDIDQRAERDKVPYRQWRDEGYITATPGNATDFRWIERDIREVAETYELRELAYDRFLAGPLINDLEDSDVTLVPFGQGYVSMGGPSAEFDRLVRACALQHGANPVLTWCADNVVVTRDPADNIKPDKSKSTERIDGIVAAIMALGRAQLHQDTETVYDRGQGIRSIEW